MSAELAPVQDQKTKREPGLYPGLSYAEYERIDAINHSILRHFRKSPAHARVEMTTPSESTAAKDFGHAYHCAVLEPARYAVEFVRGLEGVGNRSNADKAQWAEFRQLHAEKTVLMPEEFDLVAKMQEAMYCHPTAAELLHGEGINEVVAVWVDEETGLLCKSRMDRFVAWMGWSFVADLKTTRDGSAEGWPREVNTYGYDSAAAYYIDGLNALAPRERRFLHITQEKEPPFAVAIYELDEISIDVGRRRYRRYLNAYSQAMASGAWPAYPDGIIPTSLPRWAFRQEED